MTRWDGWEEKSWKEERQFLNHFSSSLTALQGKRSPLAAVGLRWAPRGADVETTESILQPPAHPAVH